MSHDGSLEAPTRLNFVRTILVVLISLSLAVTPTASTWAAAPGNAESHEQSAGVTGQPGVDHAALSDVAGMDMSDCMKAMQASAGDPSKSDCKCCDAKHKCPDTANCMAKCCKVIGALKSAGKVMTLTAMVYRRVQPAKPAEWLRTPPAPPPRS